jgi:hypothetical protein
MEKSPKREPGRVLVMCTHTGAIEGLMALFVAFAAGLAFWMTSVWQNWNSVEDYLYAAGPVFMLLLGLWYLRRAKRFRLLARQNCLDIYRGKPRRIWYTDIELVAMWSREGESVFMQVLKSRVGLGLFVRLPKARLYLTLRNGEELTFKGPPWIPHHRFTGLCKVVRRHVDRAPAETPDEEPTTQDAPAEAQ